MTPWRLRVDVQDDDHGDRPTSWRTRAAVVVLLLAVSVWVVVLTVLAVWLAAVITP